jgi:beta-galactosidase
VIYGSENGMALTAWDAVKDNEYISGQYLWTGIDYLGEARSWPMRSNTAGLIDLAGFKKPQFYFRQSLWADKPMVYIGHCAINNRRRNITASWNYKEGDSVRISCYTNCGAAELFLNGRSLGRKQSARCC